MRTLSTLAIVLASLLTLATAQAQTWDGIAPAEELVCDELEGREFGLCNAYCEALDCDSQIDPVNACSSLRNNFYRLTGSSALPCDAFCPDVDVECSGNGVLVTDASGCSTCACDPGFSGSECATCEVGFDACGVCGGDDIDYCD